MLCDTHGQHPLQLPAYYKCITTLFANHDKHAFIVDRIFNSLLALLFYNKNKKKLSFVWLYMTCNIRHNCELQFDGVFCILTFVHLCSSVYSVCVMKLLLVLLRVSPDS